MEVFEEEKIRKEAQKFIQKNKPFLFKKFADDAVYIADDFSVTVFMAGSPGAGKTEVSRGLVDQFSSPAVRIDADEIRSLCHGYTGDNSHLFQSAASIGVDALYNYCLDRNFNMVVDGTFAHQKTISNIEKSLAKGRKVVIYFVYQDPQIAWDFTKKREIVEQRRITRESFIHGYQLSMKNVSDAKTQFGDQIELNLLVKSLSNDEVSAIYTDILEVDSYLNKIYTTEELENIII